jgi:hypothetical protein
MSFLFGFTGVHGFPRSTMLHAIDIGCRQILFSQSRRGLRREPVDLLLHKTALVSHGEWHPARLGGRCRRRRGGIIQCRRVHVLRRRCFGHLIERRDEFRRIVLGREQAVDAANIVADITCQHDSDPPVRSLAQIMVGVWMRTCAKLDGLGWPPASLASCPLLAAQRPCQ